MSILCFFFKDTATHEIYTYCHTLSLHDALPIFVPRHLEPEIAKRGMPRQQVAMALPGRVGGSCRIVQQALVIPVRPERAGMRRMGQGMARIALPEPVGGDRKGVV